jgi:hypothetical protein
MATIAACCRRTTLAQEGNVPAKTATNRLILTFSITSLGGIHPLLPKPEKVYFPWWTVEGRHLNGTNTVLRLHESAVMGTSGVPYLN